MSSDVPEGWVAGQVLDFFQLQRGHDLPIQERKAGSVPIIASNGVVGFHDQSSLTGPGVITGRSGSIGNVRFVEGAYWPLNTALYVRDFKGSDPKFVYYFLQNFPLKDHSTGTGVPTLNRNDVHTVEVVFPPLDEQRRIADVLLSVDEAIAAKSAAIMQSKRVLSTVRETLFQPYGPGFDQVPDRWQNTQLGKVCRLWNGRAYKKEELLEVGKYLVLRVGNFFTNDRWYYSDLELEDEKYCDAGDLLYAWSASFGPRVWAGGKVIYHYHIWKITVDDRLIDKDFLFHFLDWDAEQIKSSLGSGSTMIHVTKGAMEQRAISLPPLDEQRRIANTLAAIHEGINHEKADLERASQMKVALMADLLSGHVRVPA